MRAAPTALLLLLLLQLLLLRLLSWLAGAQGMEDDVNKRSLHP